VFHRFTGRSGPARRLHSSAAKEVTMKQTRLNAVLDRNRQRPLFDFTLAGAVLLGLFLTAFVLTSSMPGLTVKPAEAAVIPCDSITATAMTTRRADDPAATAALPDDARGPLL
jgi:hypothetical protein